MKRHFAYLRYVLRHKWFVFVGGRRVGASLWRTIIHDWSKFLPSEWESYVDYFYGGKRKLYSEFSPAQKYQFDCWAISKEGIKEKFDYAWNHHQKRNKHHWQYWLLQMDRGDVIPLEMPTKYISEMVADWMGAGRAITGRWECQEWYEANKDKMILNYQTRIYVESLLRIAKP